MHTFWNDVILSLGLVLLELRRFQILYMFRPSSTFYGPRDPCQYILQIYMKKKMTLQMTVDISCLTAINLLVHEAPQPLPACAGIAVNVQVSNITILSLTFLF